LRRLRDESYSSSPDGTVPGRGCKRNRIEQLAWKAWAFLNTHPRLNQLATAIAGLAGDYLPPIGPLERWMRHRSEPTFAARSLHHRLRKEGIADE
jgi:hypothetical protein